VAAGVGRVDQTVSDLIGIVPIAVEQPAQLGEGEIVGDAVGHREQHVAVFYRNLPQVWGVELFAKGAVHHVALLEVRVFEQSGRRDDLAEAELEIPIRAEDGVVQRALEELAGRRVPVDPAVSDVADQGLSPRRRWCRTP
jgi:hypothetical protein